MEVINSDLSSINLDDDILNTAFIENNNCIIIDHERSYIKYDEHFCCFHRLNEEQAEKLLSDLVEGSWIIWNNTKKNTNAITIKLNEGYVHHYDFIYDIFDDKYKVYVIAHNPLDLIQKVINDENESNISDINFKYIGYFKNENEKVYIEKVYKNFYDFLVYLNKAYGLDIDKQVIFEND